MAVTFASLKKDHLPLLYEWINRPHVRQWWGRGQDRTFQQVEEKYASGIEGKKAVAVFGFVTHSERKPIGYIQYYPVAEFRPDGVLDVNNELLRNYDIREMAGVDIFIGDEDYVGKGYGTMIIRQFLDEIIFPHFSIAVIDPQAINLRAIRAYEKCGFVKTDASQNPEFLLLVACRTSRRAAVNKDNLAT